MAHSNVRGLPLGFRERGYKLGGGAANHPLKIGLERDKARIPIFDHGVQSFSVSPDKEPQPHPSHANQTSKRTNSKQQTAFVASTA